MAILPLQIARVSNSLRTNVASQSIARTQAQLLRVQNEMATGRKISVPSDNPGEAAIAQQLRKTLEQRDAHMTNLQRANSHLGEVDATLGEMTDLLREAQTLASANVGSDVTAEERANAATIIDSLYSRALALANKQFEGVYLFGGDRATDQPFSVEDGGVKFVGSNTVLRNSYDENTVLPFMVSGGEVFGATSTRVEVAPRGRRT